MSLPEAHPTKVSNLRRSQRVCLSVPVVVIKGGPGKNASSEETRTLVVSAHGALLVLLLPLQVGDLLILRHTKTQEELTCRVVHLGPDQFGKREVGVEFEAPAPRFWRIAFPPADWSPRNADAKPPSPQPPNGRAPQASQKKPTGAPTEAEKKQPLNQKNA